MMKRTVVALVFSLLLLGPLSGCVQDRSATKPQIEAKQNLGRALLAEGDKQSALKTLLEAAEMDPENEGLHNTIGLTYADLGQMAKAESHLKRALQIKPDYSDAMNHLGLVYNGQGRHGPAIEMFTRAGDDFMYPSRFAAYNNLGNVYLGMGQYQKALEGYKKALQVFPEYSKAHDNMGLTYEALREWDLAIEAYKFSIQYAPEYPLSYLHLANLYLRFKRYEEARPMVLKAIDVDKTGEFKSDAKRLLEECEKRG
jgi:tetratricopeptide (TPR) repeat protein